MSLTLTLLRCPDDVAPETRRVMGGEFSIGRGSDNDWILPDPERGLSKRHCVFTFRAGGWKVADLSTNGTFLNHEAEPIGRGQTRDLRSGDRLSFGAYEIEIQVDDDAAVPRRSAASVDPYAARRSASPELFALDPFAAASDREAAGLAPDPLLDGASAFDPFAPPLAAGAVALPPDFDPLAPDPAEHGFHGPTQPDHSPHLENAFAAPVVRPVLPEDWDRDMSPPSVSPQAEPALVTPPAEAPVASPLRVPDREAAEEFPVVGPVTGAAASNSPRPRTPSGWPEAPAPASDDLLGAFLRGCGHSGPRPIDAAATMEALGAAFRAFVSGLRQAMIARAAVKGEFRIEQTVIRSRGNNPLKFSADDDDALGALLGVGRHTDIEPAEAISEAMRDIRLHELATMAAMQMAVRALLAEFEPAKLRQSAGQGALTLLSAQRKASAWDAFEALHARVSQALLDDFDSVFGKAFARAYERALDEISVRKADAP